jgi:outer membrane protein OmpA-like peptidoglycan-associated protein
MKKLLLLSAVLFLVACESTPPPAVPRSSTPRPPASPAIPMPPARPAPLPPQATAGPLTVQGVEKYLDGLERGLRGLMKGRNIRVSRRGDSLLVVLPDARLFSGEAVGPQGAALVAILARALRYYDRTIGSVNGYTDACGDFSRNVTQSQAKAERALEALERAGVASGRFSAHGFGPANPKIVTGDQAAEPRNRRIEIEILPKPE